jgi:protein SCO1/2
MDTTTSERNQTQRVIYALMGALMVMLLVGSGVYLWIGGAGGGLGIGGPFTLEDGNGHTVTDADFHGKYMLVYFGYTYCPDVCPTTLTAVADAMDRLGADAAKIRPVFITVDPRRDTPAVMKQYTAAFGPALVGLTGTPQEVAQVAKEYRVYYAKHRTGPGPNDYAMDHSSVLYLVNPQGQFVAPLRADLSGRALAEALKRLIG